MILSESTRVINGNFRFKAVNKKGELEKFSGGFDSLSAALDWYYKHGHEFVKKGRTLVLTCFKPGLHIVIGDEITKEKRYIIPELRK